MYDSEIFRDVTSYGLANDLNGKYYGKFRYQLLETPRRGYADLVCTEKNNELCTASGLTCGEVSLLVGGRKVVGCGGRRVKGASGELYDAVVTANILNFATTQANSRFFFERWCC